MADFPFNRLPHDIARIILEEAAISSRKTLLNIILVSRAVRRWIEPILYRQVHLSTPSTGALFCASIQSRNDAAFFARTVRSLTVTTDTMGEEHMATILSSCIHIKSLYIIVPPRVNTLPTKSSLLKWPYTTQMKPSKDIADLRHLNSLTHVTLTDPFRIHSMTLRTNLHDMLNAATRVVSSAGILQDVLRAQPSLTHVRYDLGRYAFQFIFGDSSVLSDLWSYTTASCPNLRVFVIHVGPDLVDDITQPLPMAAKRDETDILETERLIDRLRGEEPRLVIINSGCEDFEGVKNVLDSTGFDQDDIWEKAEEYLKQTADIQA